MEIKVQQLLQIGHHNLPKNNNKKRKDLVKKRHNDLKHLAMLFLTDRKH